MTYAQISNGEPTQEIQALTLRIQHLDQKVDWWNTAMIWALIFAALAAVAVVVTTRMALVRAKQLTDSQADLDRAKDRQSSADSHDKDLKIAGLKKESAALLKQLVSQGSRPALLYGSNRTAFADKLKPFHDQRVELRYGRTSFNQSFIDNETMGLLTMLEVVLSQDAKWAVNPLVTDNISGTGVEVAISPEASEKTRKAASALWLALHNLPLAMVGDKPFIRQLTRPPQVPTYTTNGKLIPLPPLDADTIVVMVLAHP